MGQPGANVCMFLIAAEEQACRATDDARFCLPLVKEHLWQNSRCNGHAAFRVSARQRAAAVASISRKC